MNIQDLGFKVIDNHIEITGSTSINNQQIQVLINSYLLELSPIDVQLKYFIPFDIVERFYNQLGIVKQTIIDLIIGNYHTGDFRDNRDNKWFWGLPCESVDELKFWLFFVCKRDFDEKGEWLYTVNNFDELKGFFDVVVDLFIGYNGNDYEVLKEKIRTMFPFVQF